MLSEKTSWRRPSRRVEPPPDLGALVAEYVRDDAGVPLGVLSGSPLREDGETHREAWMRVVRADPCAYCGRLPRKTLEPDTVTCAPLGTLDHIDPQSQRPRGLGGNHSWTNYAGACANCNQKKGSKSLLNFLAGRRGVRVPAESKDAGRRAA